MRELLRKWKSVPSQSKLLLLIVVGMVFVAIYFGASTYSHQGYRDGQIESW